MQMPHAIWPIMGKHDIIHKTGITYRITHSSNEDRATAPDLTSAENFDMWFLRYATAQTNTYPGQNNENAQHG